MQKLKEFWISQASAEQRKGRAGEGWCFFMFLLVVIVIIVYFQLYCSLQLTTWSGYEVHGMILFHDLKEAMQLGHSKDMSVHDSAYTSYDFSVVHHEDILGEWRCSSMNSWPWH